MKHSMGVTVLNTIKNLIDIALWGGRERGRERDRERGKEGERAAITNMMECFCVAVSPWHVHVVYHLVHWDPWISSNHNRDTQTPETAFYHSAIPPTNCTQVHVVTNWGCVAISLSYLTIFGWSSSLSSDISLIAVDGTPSHSLKFGSIMTECFA